MDKLRAYANQYGIILTDHMLLQFQTYEKMLLEWNQKINLTAITEHEDVLLKHFLDSLLLLRLNRIADKARVIDIGTGAGFPGIPLKIARPDIELTLLDSLGKRVTFLTEVSAAIGQEKNKCIHARAEDGAHDAALRETYEIACARALAGLPALLEYCLPFVKPNSYFLAMKGAKVREEVEQAENALSLLGGKIEEISIFTLPNENQRGIVVVKKIAHTSGKYPRKGQKIAKFPL